MDTSYLKFFVKVYLIGAARAVLVFLSGVRVNKNDWEKRMLIVNLDGLGDLALMTGVLKHYKKDFPDREITFLVRSGIGADASLFAGLVDKVLFMDGERFKKDPLYGLDLINRLRTIGFRTVINHDPSIGDILGRELAVRLGAEETIGYEGLGIQFALPYDQNMALGIQYVKKHFFPRYTKIVPSIDKNADFSKRLVSFMKHYIAIYESATGKVKEDYAPVLGIDVAAEKEMLALLAKNTIAPGSYCVLSLGTSTPHREWPAERFAEVLNSALDLPIILVGSKGDVGVRDRFKKVYRGTFLDLVGVTSIPQVVALMKHSLLSFSNDTAPTHMSVALAVPSLTVLGLGHFGMLSFYGYSDINRWVYSKTATCLCDNWRCIHSVPALDPSPCVETVKVFDVQRELHSLVDYLKKAPVRPKEKFSTNFNL